MKALVIGYGSIGSRHIQNLSLISNMEIVVQTKRKMNTFLKQNNCKLIRTINDAIKEKPDFAIISTETNLHLKIATKLAQNNIPFLLEKPLSHTLNGIDKLLEIVQECIKDYNALPKQQKEQMISENEVACGKHMYEIYLNQNRRLI